MVGYHGKDSMRKAQRTPKELRKVMKSHRGSISRLASELGVARQTITTWLQGKFTSERIAAGVARMASELEAKNDNPKTKNNLHGK